MLLALSNLNNWLSIDEVFFVLVMSIIVIQRICSTLSCWLQSDIKCFWYIKSCIMKILLRRSLDLSYICRFKCFIKVLCCFLLWGSLSCFLNSVVQIITYRILSLISFRIKPPLWVNSFFPVACSNLIWSPRVSSSCLIPLSPS